LNHQNKGFLRASTGLGVAFGVGVAVIVISCGDTAPHVTYIGLVDATPPRLGRSSNSLPGGGEIDAATDGEVSDAGAQASPP
jgi:hypothetical protein